MADLVVREYTRGGARCTHARGGAKPHIMITRRFFLASFAAALALLKSFRPAKAQPRTQATRVTFVLVNDIYLMNEQAMPDGRVRGGFARLATVVKAERAKHKNVVFAHGGDTLSPSVMSGFDRGKHIVALTNMVAPDVFVAGNHEFDFGKETFFERMREAKFPLYGANMRLADGNPVPGHRDNIMLELDGVKVGIAGIAYEHSAKLSSPEDLKFLPTIETAKAQAELLRKLGADFVVEVLHCDRGDALLLQFSRSADLLLTGHTHDLFINYDGDVGIVESSYDAHYVTAIDVDITVREIEGRRVTAWRPQFRAIDTADVTPDANVAAAVARFDADFTREALVPIAKTEVELDSRNATVRTREAAIGNLFSDAMRISMKADAAIINGGGIRAGKVYEANSVITRLDVLKELPFNNRVVVIEIKGAELRRAIENGLSQLPVAAGRFPQVSGIRVTFDPKRKFGERIVSMEVAGSALDPEKIYRVAILDFLARGGDGYAMLREAKRITPDADAPLLANEVIAYIRSLGTVRVKTDGRLTPL